MHFFSIFDDRGGPLSRSRFRGRRVSSSRPDSIKELPCKLVWCMLNSVPDILSLVGRRSLERGVPAQVSSSLSDSGSKLRVPSQYSPRIASNIIERERF
ncbi:hypothetical protein AVEN_216597-1 [Araneus ventricosus]|uniref:Uncharacterized protein n=1 Tax=Araneus ventricosus TaxID=182803 RepID=A0A4Y1ZQK9_ARAVE|nr:hypothetical protein AVEN_150205-1 [Araneus ventricosus]GBL62378.1 hypothetical protein AVEN_216597-1 [Araneus ventricosus]